MKKLFVLALAVLIFSCDRHIPNPPVTALSSDYAEILFDTISQTYWSPEIRKIDSIQLNLTVRGPSRYLLTINDFSTVIKLSQGDTTIAIALSSFEAGDTIRVTAADDRFPDESIAFAIPVKKTEIPLVRNLSIPFETVQFDTVHALYYSERMNLHDSLKVSMQIQITGNFNMNINGNKQTLLLNRGDTTLTFAWDQFELFDSLRVEIGEVSRPYDVAKVTVPYLKIGLLNDPLLLYTWHLLAPIPSFVEKWNIDTASTIHIESVWKTNRGAGVKVAILDDGIQPEHEDLAGNVIATWDAATNSSSISPRNSYHGTGVAGMVGAVGSNRIGISGVAPEASLILIRFNVDFGSDEEIISAFTKAREFGAQVINCSWGTYDVSEAVASIIQEMYDSGIIVVFAAGNNGMSLDGGSIRDESELPTVIGVGASSEKNDFWSGSDYGANLELIAPGAGSPGVVILDGMGSSGGYDVLNENYRYWSGCSFSSPLIAGVCALLLVENPSLTPDQIRTILISTTDKVGGANAQYNALGFDLRRMYGKVNVEKAIALARQM